MPNERLSKIRALIQEKQNISSTMKTQFWKPSGLLRRITPSTKIQSWLNTPKSLTAKLKILCPNLEVVVLSEELEIPLLNESQKLGLHREETAWVRCVLLKCNDTSWVYARTVIPNFQPNNPWHELQNLGTKPLGEVLFEMPSIHRTPFEFSKDSLDYWPHLIDSINDKNAQKFTGFARRSIFSQNKHPLLLTEVFLPGLLN